MAERTVRFSAPKGYLDIQTIPTGRDGTPPAMPPPLSPEYAVLSVDIARARLAAELLTLRAKGFTAPLHLPRVLFLYLRVRQATTLANAIVASARAQQAAGGYLELAPAVRSNVTPELRDPS
jgi:hypothetical protein